MLVRPHAALYIGGMGSKKVNFYHGIATAMGYEREADEVQEKFLARDYTGAAAAVPFEFIDRTILIGDTDRIVERLEALDRQGVTTVNISPADPDPEARSGSPADRACRPPDRPECSREPDRRDHPRHRRGPDRVPPGLLHRTPDHRQQMLGYDIADPGITAFTAVIQVGAIIAVIIYFWSDIKKLVLAWVRGLLHKERARPGVPDGLAGDHRLAAHRDRRIRIAALRLRPAAQPVDRRLRDDHLGRGDAPRRGRRQTGPR